MNKTLSITLLLLRSVVAQEVTPSNVITDCSIAVSSAYPISGGSGGLGISTSPGCAWTIAGVPAWITLSNVVSGSGSGVVAYSVQPNAGAPRSATLTIADQAFGITQAGDTNPPPDPGTWVRTFGGTGGDMATTVATDGAGNIIVAGAFSLSTAFDANVLTSAGARDIFIAKLGVDGAVQWARRFGSTGDEFVRTMALDAAGNIYLGGTFTGSGSMGGAAVLSTGGLDSFIAKYTADGTYVWSRTWGGIRSDVVNSIALDASQQNILVTGYFQDRVTFTPTTTLTSVNLATDTFLGKYSAANGAPLWVRSFPNVDLDMGIVVFVDRGDNVFLAGNFLMTIDLGAGVMHTAGTTYNRDIYVAKFAPSGVNAPATPIWAYRLGGITSENLFTGTLDGNGDLLLGGTFSGQQTDLGGGVVPGRGINADMFVAKYSGVDGRYLWARPILCVSGGAPRAIRVDSLNNPTVCGYYYGTVDFTVRTFTSVGSWDVYIAKYSGASGTPISADSIGGTGGEDCYGVAVDRSDRPIVAGCYDGTTSIGGRTIVSTGFSDAFVFRLAQ